MPLNICCFDVKHAKPVPLFKKKKAQVNEDKFPCYKHTRRRLLCLYYVNTTEEAPFTFPRSLFFFFCPELFLKESTWVRMTGSTGASGNSETI